MTFILIYLYQFMRNKIVQHALFRTSQFSENSSFKADLKGFSQTYDQSNLSISGSWDSVLEIKESYGHIVLNLGVNLIVLPITAFKDNQHHQQVLKSLESWKSLN